MFQQIIDFVLNLHSVEGIKDIIQTGGLVALTFIVFAETGLLAGFFLPGDSLLVTAGIFAASDGMGGPGIFNLPLLIGVLCVAAVIGDQLGYLLGRKTGKLILSRKDSFFFKKKHFQAAHDFYEKHGARSVILARFVPIFRTFVPFAAGVADMDYMKYVKVNVLGGILWVNSMVLLGYFVGQTSLGQQLHKVIMVVIFVSILPILISMARKGIEMLRARSKKNKTETQPAGI